MQIFCCLFVPVTSAMTAPTILVLGDSLSAAHEIPDESSWVNLLDRRLKEKFPKSILINSSYSGETTTQGLARLPGLLAEFNPNIVLLELGGNDGLRGLPLVHIQRNLKKMIALCKQSHATVVLIGIQIPPNYGPRYQKRFFEIYEALAKEYQLPIVPFLLEGVALNPKLMQADGIHPNEEAQPIILETVWGILEDQLYSSD